MFATSSILIGAMICAVLSGIWCIYHFGAINAIC